jgi:hypothetical protein
MTVARPISDGVGRKAARPLADAERAEVAILDRFAQAVYRVELAVAINGFGRGE